MPLSEVRQVKSLSSGPNTHTLRWVVPNPQQTIQPDPSLLAHMHNAAIGGHHCPVIIRLAAEDRRAWHPQYLGLRDVSSGIGAPDAQPKLLVWPFINCFSVRTQPGAKALTRIFRGPSSRANE